jgi:hypothetical protein
MVRCRAVAAAGVLVLAGIVCSAAAEASCPRIVGIASVEGTPSVFKAYIGGEWRTSASGKTLKVLSPVNETVLFEVQVTERDSIFVCGHLLRDTGRP